LHFNTVFESMYSLLLFGTLLDNVGLLTNRLGKESVFYAALFFMFILFAAYTILNMLVGVLCEVVSAVAATEREEMLVTFVNRKVKTIVEELDKNGDNCISKAEFVKILENAEAVRSLQDVGVDVVGLVDFADVIFEDGAQELSFEKFMDIVLQLRGTNTASVKDIVELRKLVRTNNIQTNHLLARIEGRICSQAPKPGHVTPSLTTVSFDSADLDRLGIRAPTENMMGIVQDSFPFPPLGSARAMFMNHDEDAESLPSVDDNRGAGHCIDQGIVSKASVLPAKPEFKVPHAKGVTPLNRPERKPKAHIAPEVLPEIKGQWTPCARPGEGMHVCRAMLEHISIIGSRPPTHQLEPQTNWGVMPAFDEPRVDVDWYSAELQELQGKMAGLERLFSTSVLGVGQCQPVGAVSPSVNKVLSSGKPLTWSSDNGVGLPTCDVCTGADKFSSNTPTASSLTLQRLPSWQEL